jgi:hypothetical protein
VSYHIGSSLAPHALAPAIQPHQYQLLPLSQVPSTALAPPGLDANTKRILILIGILLLAVIVFSMLSKKSAKVTRNPVKRVSTPELAKNLYERLERRGNANETTMRSLKAYASKR